MFAIAVLASLAGPVLAGDAPPTTAASFPPSVVKRFESLPIQDGGRVKPIASFARFTLLRIAGSTRAKDAEGAAHESTEWLLRLCLFPEVAAGDPVVLVEDVQAVEAVGLPHEGKKKRDRWSYAELMPALPQILDRAQADSGIDAAQRTPIQAQTIRLAESALTILRLGRAFDFAREHIPLQMGTRAANVFPDQAEVSVADIVAHGPALAALERELASSDEGREKGAVEALWRGAAELCADAQMLAWIPPSVSVDEDPNWKTPADLVLAARRGVAVDEAHVAILRAAEDVASRRTDPVRLEIALVQLHDRVLSLATARGEGAQLETEVVYQRLGLLSWSLVAFLLGFALTALAWLRPKSRALNSGKWLAAAAAVSLLIAVIVMRCWIRGRPPVSTLYETVLFVTATGALVALGVEWVHRTRVAIAAACLFGACGIFLANGYERLDGQDTMPSLVAVLDTNFWLSTHVTSITLGYAAGMLAALLGSVYLIVSLVRGSRANAAAQHGLARAVYGVTCFALCFAVVGTILGGIWANESWGRFWGWDPKENGALLICISQIALVHGRRGGFLRDPGTCMAAAFGGTIVAFSWWGVNLLGVGLHSYGFTSGVHTALWTYYGVQWGIVGLGGLAWLRDRKSRKGLGSVSSESMSSSADQAPAAATTATARPARARRGKPDLEEIPAALPSTSAPVPNADPR